MGRSHIQRPASPKPIRRNRMPSRRAVRRRVRSEMPSSAARAITALASHGQALLSASSSLRNRVAAVFPGPDAAPSRRRPTSTTSTGAPSHSTLPPVSAYLSAAGSGPRLLLIGTSRR